MRLRYDRSTRHCRDRFEHALKKLGRILYIKGYRYFGRYQTTHEAVLVVGVNGSCRFGGLLWGYGGEGPRGTCELLLTVGVPKITAENVAFHTPRRYPQLGEDWRLTVGWNVEQPGGECYVPAVA